MAVTLGSSGITFSNGTTQNSKASTLSGVQYTGYTGMNYLGQQGFQTSVHDRAHYNWGFNTTLSNSTANTVMCGTQMYRSGNAQIGNDGYQDAGTLQTRMAYRTIS